MREIDSKILSTVGGLLYPFLVMYGFYIVVNGDLSPGGGFQGGVIFATAFFIRFLLERQNPYDIKWLARIEKLLFLSILLTGMLSLITRQEVFTNFFSVEAGTWRRLFLVLLNVLIGMKVTSGVISIISSFVEEGDHT